MYAHHAPHEHVMPGLRGIHDRVLDALDDAPQGWISGYGCAFSGSLTTIQGLASALGVSDSAARRAVHDLRERGLVQVWDALDPQSRRRRLYVSGEASK